MVGEQRVEHLGIEMMQLVGRVHQREPRLELEQQADVAELEVGVDQDDFLVGDRLSSSATLVATTVLPLPPLAEVTVTMAPLSVRTGSHDGLAATCGA